VMPNLNVRRNALNEVIISREYCVIVLFCYTLTSVTAAVHEYSIIPSILSGSWPSIPFLSPEFYLWLPCMRGFAVGYR